MTSRIPFACGAIRRTHGSSVVELSVLAPTGIATHYVSVARTTRDAMHDAFARPARDDAARALRARMAPSIN